MREITALYADISVWAATHWETLAPFVAFLGVGVVLGLVTLLIHTLRIPDIQFLIHKQARVRERYRRRLLMKVSRMTAQRAAAR